MIPHQLSENIVDGLLRKIAPARGGDLLDPATLAELKPRVNRYRRFVAIRIVVILVPLTAALSYSAYWLDSALDDPAVNALLNTRWAFPWIGPGLCMAMACAHPIAARLQKRWWGDDAALYDRFVQTQKGWDPRRVERCTMPLAMVISVCLGALIWRSGEIVDENGIRFKSGPVFVHRFRYDRIRSIGLYDRLNAPIGVRDQFNLEIRFDADPPLRLLANRSTLSHDVLERVAAYASKRSGILTTRGELRPE